MADYSSHVETPAPRKVFTLRLPTNHVEIEKMLGAVRGDLARTWPGTSVADDAITVDSDGEQLTAWFVLPKQNVRAGDVIGYAAGGHVSTIPVDDRPGVLPRHD